MAIAMLNCVLFVAWTAWDLSWKYNSVGDLRMEWMHTKWIVVWMQNQLGRRQKQGDPEDNFTGTP